MTSESMIECPAPPTRGERPIQCVTSGAFRLGDWLIEPTLGCITSNGFHHVVEPKTMDVLVHLAARPGEVISSDELIESVWRGRPMGDNPVHKCVSQLRSALRDDARHPRYIGTIPKKGYRLLVQVEPLDGTPVPASTAGPIRLCIDIWSPMRIAAPARLVEDSTGVEIVAQRSAGKWLDGALRSAGRELRITAQLSDATSDFPSSPTVLGLEIEDIVGIIQKIAQAVTASPP